MVISLTLADFPASDVTNAVVETGEVGGNGKMHSCYSKGENRRGHLYRASLVAPEANYPVCTPDEPVHLISHFLIGKLISCYLR